MLLFVIVNKILMFLFKFKQDKTKISYEIRIPNDLKLLQNYVTQSTIKYNKLHRVLF